jgi:hypothetical protein
LVSEYEHFRDVLQYFRFTPLRSGTSPKMAVEFHKNPLPAWIVLPFLFAATVAVLAAWGTGSLVLGLATACVGAASAAWWCERTPSSAPSR